MTPEELAETLRAVVGPAATTDVSFGQVTVDVPVEGWADAATTLRDDPSLELRFFDWLSAYDDGDPRAGGVDAAADDGGAVDGGDADGGGDDGGGDDAGLAVVVNLWSTTRQHSVRLRTHVPRSGGRLATLTGAWAGADWHERETFEMFGIGFDGHPNLVPLLLPDGFEGNPLRKEFVLASRVAKAWPGEKEPGESDADLAASATPAEGADAHDAPVAAAPRRARRRMLPPGVPEPGEWGPAR
jgi:NADH-quinone oxidoreductase subunit C